MSGARTPAPPSSATAPRSSSPACGNAFCEPSTVLLGRALKPRPAAMANKARNARAATIQGSALVLDSRATVAVPPAAVPQRWQNFAPGPSSAAQAEQVAPASGAPQLEQYRPVAVAPQTGHFVAGSVEVGECIRLKILKCRVLCIVLTATYDYRALL